MLCELKSSPVRLFKSSTGFLLSSFSFDSSEMVDRSGTAHVIGNNCLRLDPKVPTFNIADPCPTMLVLVVSSSLSRYHFDGRAAGGCVGSSERSSVRRLLLTSVPKGLWYTVLFEFFSMLSVDSHS